ncbi:MAG: hypothetical protein ACE5D7_03245 [Fidelibacterota bacterium]
MEIKIKILLIILGFLLPTVFLNCDLNMSSDTQPAGFLKNLEVEQEWRYARREKLYSGDSVFTDDIVSAAWISIDKTMIQFQVNFN